MLGLVIAGVSAFAAALSWYKIIVPLDRVQRLSEELNDSQWCAGGEPRQAVGPGPTPPMSAVSGPPGRPGIARFVTGREPKARGMSPAVFGRDLQNLNASLRSSISPGAFAVSDAAASSLRATHPPLID